MTPEQRAAVIESLDQAKHFRNQALRAPAELQNPDRIRFYDQHITRMAACLAADAMPVTP